MPMAFRKLAIIGSTNHGINHKPGVGNIQRGGEGMRRSFS